MSAFTVKQVINPEPLVLLLMQRNKLFTSFSSSSSSFFLIALFSCFFKTSATEIPQKKIMLNKLCCSEIQLKTPNWLFGQRKYEESSSAPKTVANDSANTESQKKEVDAICDLSWLFPMGETSEDDLYQRYLSIFFDIFSAFFVYYKYHHHTYWGKFLFIT